MRKKQSNFWLERAYLYLIRKVLPSVWRVFLFGVFMWEKLEEFRRQYPNGCLLSEVIQVFKNEFVVRVTVVVDGVSRATGLAADGLIINAEDKARLRALAVLGIGDKPKAAAPVKQSVNQVGNVVDLSDVIAAIDVQMNRIGWSHVNGQSYLVGTYGKGSRSMLNEQELREFLEFLKGQPDVV
jgi:hypothetical protein